ncbi:hypothetical protein DRJ22_00940 [Candidatus Woesearchaeota archaeon]|nr:MAG: hypothetical protein DRJ22_00940 [Candidatus Woesearchaeota archaeon]
MSIAYAATVFADLNGATITAGPGETQAQHAAGSYVAQGGNITMVNITGKSQTRVWQGFYGKTSGSLTLDDASGNTMYNWTLANRSGIVLVSRTNALNFTSITGITDCTVDEDLQGSNYKRSDRVNKTFTRNNSISWDVGGYTITDACQTWTYNSSGFTRAFEEIMVNVTNAYSAYATKIQNDSIGFNGQTVDYQLIVPETKQKSQTTTYYFYVEFTG